MTGSRVPFAAAAAPDDATTASTRRGAYFAFAHFPARSAHRALGWREASREIAQSLGIEHIPPLREDGVVGWRLITENNRELARSFRLFRNEREAQQDAVRLRAEAGALDLHVVVTAQLRGAGWCGALDGSPVLIGARRYENRSAAREAARLALRLLSTAVRERPPEAGRTS